MRPRSNSFSASLNPIDEPVSLTWLLDQPFGVGLILEVDDRPREISPRHRSDIRLGLIELPSRSPEGNARHLVSEGTDRV